MAFDRNAWARDRKRQETAKRTAAKNANGNICQYGLGRGICGGTIRDATDGNGRLLRVCDRCERRKRGLCLDCNAPVTGKRSIRCARHKAEAKRMYVRRHHRRHLERVRKQAREYQRRVKEKATAYKRLWRAANPDKVNEQKRRDRLRGNNAARLRRYRAKARKPSVPMLRVDGLRVCVSCHEIVVTRQKRKCSKCRERERIAALEQLAARKVA